jgi:protein phosphatase
MVSGAILLATSDIGPLRLAVLSAFTLAFVSAGMFWRRSHQAANGLHETSQASSSSLSIEGRMIGLKSDIGRTRSLDEDSLLVSEVHFGTSEAPLYLLAVADGMGGHSKGEVASRIAIETLRARSHDAIFQESAKWDVILADSFAAANEAILNKAKSDSEASGMGTTMTGLVLEGNRAQICHVGDTRCYLINEDAIRLLTKDHSYVQELVDKGELTPEQAKHHPQKNVITRVVGYYESVSPDRCLVELGNTDRLLICCDGLVNLVEDAEIKRIVVEAKTPSAACRALVDLANERGGNDNISVIITPPIDELLSGEK